MRLIFMGPPGSGKGTQAARIADRYEIPAISTGDIFRANVADRTALGLSAQKYMDAGDYVPDDITDAMVRARLAEADCTRGFLLDGYPRTLSQVNELDSILIDQDATLDAAIVLLADHNQLLDRLLKRATIDGRTDDTPEVITRRLDIYHEQTAPLIDLYVARGLAREVDGHGSVEEVTSRIQAALAVLPSSCGTKTRTPSA